MKTPRVFKLSCLFVAAASYALPLSAENVYRWTAPDGTVHYSTTPPNKDAKPAELPKIMKFEMKMPEMKFSSCEGHGGVNCQAGADSDGSVVCYDGFKNSSAPYRFACASPKLAVADISPVDENGSFTVFVRNSKGVAAQKVRVAMKTKTGREIALEGPDTVDPSGTSEYHYKPAAGSTPAQEALLLSGKPEAGQISISCANCP